MNSRRHFITISLAVVSMIAVGCAGSKPAANVSQDEIATPILQHPSADRLQSVPAVATPSVLSPESNDPGKTGRRIVEALAEQGREPRGGGAPGAAKAVDLGRWEVATQTQPAPSSAVSGSEQGAIIQVPVPDVVGTPPAEPFAGDAPSTPSPTAADAPPPTFAPPRPALGETAGGVATVDTGWGPAPTKVGKLGVVKPATRPIDIDLTLVDAIKLPDGDPRREIIGIWEQVAGSNDPDFAHGDYSKSVLTFRNDGVLDIARFYGAHGEVRVNRQLAFRIENSRLVVAATQGADAIATDLPLAAGANGTTIVARKPKSALPTMLGYSAKADSIAIEGRTYKRIQAVVPQNPK